MNNRNRFRLTNTQFDFDDLAHGGEFFYDHGNGPQFPSPRYSSSSSYSARYGGDGDRDPWEDESFHHSQDQFRPPPPRYSGYSSARFPSPSANAGGHLYSDLYHPSPPLFSEGYSRVERRSPEESYHSHSQGQVFQALGYSDYCRPLSPSPSNFHSHHFRPPTPRYPGPSLSQRENFRSPMPIRNTGYSSTRSPSPAQLNLPHRLPRGLGLNVKEEDEGPKVMATYSLPLPLPLLEITKNQESNAEAAGLRAHPLPETDGPNDSASDVAANSILPHLLPIVGKMQESTGSKARGKPTPPPPSLSDVVGRSTKSRAKPPPPPSLSQTDRPKIRESKKTPGKSAPPPPQLSLAAKVRKSAESAKSAPVPSCLSPPNEENELNDCEILLVGNNSNTIKFVNAIVRKLQKLGIQRVGKMYADSETKVEKLTLPAFTTYLESLMLPTVLVVTPQDANETTITVYLMKGHEFEDDKQTEVFRGVEVNKGIMLVRGNLVRIKEKEFLAGIPVNIETLLKRVTSADFLADEDYKALISFLHQRWELSRFIEGKIKYDPDVDMPTKSEVQSEILGALHLQPPSPCSSISLSVNIKRPRLPCHDDNCMDKKTFDGVDVITIDDDDDLTSANQEGQNRMQKESLEIEDIPTPDAFNIVEGKTLLLGFSLV